MTMCTLESTVRQSLPDETGAIVVAVSGGVDSVVLLHLLRCIAVSRSAAHPLHLQVVHLNHQIRQEAEDDARFVEALCRQWNVPCHGMSCDVPALARKEGISLEMAGRVARRRLFRQVAERQGAELIALGHHRDDQVETLLLRITRGSGLSGLAGMAERDGIWWRPLLSCSRRQLLDYAKQHALKWCEDSSNKDTAFVRNALRLQVVPRLKEINPRLNERFFELGRQIASEEDYWQQQIDKHFPLLLVAEQDGLRLSRAGLLACHPALRLRLLREAVRRVCGTLDGIGAVHLRALDSLLDSSRCQSQLDLPGCWVACRYDDVWLRTHPPGLPVAFHLPVKIPGETLLPDGRRLVVTMVKRLEAESRDSIFVDLTVGGTDMFVRNWHPGDRIAPQGMTGHKRLKRIFAEMRVEKEDRHRIPLLFAGNDLLWIVGMRRSRHAAARPDTGMMARFDLI